MLAANRDYHVHYFVDGCVHEEMTLANIEREAARLGLEEICVLKHYSQELPNGEDAWVNWKRVVPGQFAAFLEDIRAHQAAARISMLAGVETELVDDSGKVNIPEEDAGRLDALILSVHWLPRMQVLSADPALNPWKPEQSPPNVVADWRKRLEECDAGAVVRNLVLAYVRAIERNPRVAVLAHMYDGLEPLRCYGVSLEALGDEQLNALMEPLMVACREKHVLWELTAAPVKRPSILKRANAVGVRFSATADAHFLQARGWAQLRDHSKAEEYIASLGLTKGRIKRNR
jgi:histidinol phosphatase-like PHP family hydrolase